MENLNIYVYSYLDFLRVGAIESCKINFLTNHNNNILDTVTQAQRMQLS